MLKDIFDYPWTSLYAKFLAIVLLYGATVHLGNISGLTGEPWLSTPLLWRVMDICLLGFNLVAAVGLWRGIWWSWIFTISGILLLQFIPYIFLRSQFILKPEDGEVLNGLLGTQGLLLGIFVILIWLKK